MSISRLRKSRGFSIVAALVMVALLTLVAVAIQSTVPAVTSPASMSAATGASDASVTEVTNSTSNTPTQNQAKVPLVPGKDVVTFLYGSQQKDRYLPVCPQLPPDPTQDDKQFVQYLKSKVGNAAGQFGSPDGRCKPDPKNANRQVPINPAAWQQWTMYCQYISPTVVPNSNSGSSAGGNGGIVQASYVDASYDDLQEATQDVANTGVVKCKILPPGAQSGGIQGGTKTPQEIQDLANKLATADPQTRAGLIQGLNPADQQALNQALTQQSSDLTTQNQQLQSRNDQINQQLQDIASNGCPNGMVGAEANPESQGAAAGEVAVDTSGCQSMIDNLKTEQQTNKQQIDANNLALKNLADAKVALSPTNNPNPNGQFPTGNTNYPYNNQQPYTGNGNLTNPYLGANNTQQSPFGGACVQRYVCSGNMLYYQSPSPYMGMYGGYTSGQCVTQPVQQCQYGCMAMNGLSGANGSNGSGSFLSDFGTGLQIASQLMRVFGGGGGGNYVNNNLSSQCAMTPQQAQGYQSPYGTGTNGQPCYQPPTQPDQSQCSTGTWKPVSATQNGCTTGWQCVPNNSTATNPSAQLSCQPQIADVGMPISFSFSCGNSDASRGSGFFTGGALSGATTTPAPNPPAGTNKATFTLTCLNQGVTASAQCQVDLNKPGIVLVTNPRRVASGDTSLIGWVTAGMQSCTVSSPDDQAFTARNAGNTSVNGAATTSPITATTRYQLDCQTLSGGSRTATTSVSIN